MGILAPIVPTISILAIRYSHWASLTCLQVEQPIICFLMPDRKTTIVAHRKHDVLAIVRWTRMGGTLPHSTCIEDGVHLVAKLTCYWVEGYLADVIFDVLVAARDWLGGRRTEIHRLAIRVSG